MVNIVFEGTTGAGKTTLIKKIKKHYSNKYKVGFTNDIDRTSPLYEVLKKMFDETPLVVMNNSINTLRYETFIQAADYLYLREKLYSENNDLNLFDRNYSSVFCYQSVLLENQFDGSDDFMNNVLECMKSGEKGIDLMVYFMPKLEKALKRVEKRDNRKISSKEKKIFKKFNDKLTEFIRYNNSEYRLLIIDQNDTLDIAFKKVVNKIDEIFEDKKMSENNKWYSLYKIDVEEFPTPDDYFKFKLRYKKKMIKKIIKYADNKKVLEAGCGTGLVAGYLQKMGFQVTALDLSQKVLDYAKKIATNSNVISPCKYKQGDILNLKYKSKDFDVVFSNGVLEHFNDEDLNKIISSQLKISKYVIFGIPSTYFGMNEKMLGNERSLTVSEWKKIINRAGGRIVEHTSFHYYKFYRRLIEVKKWFRPKAFLLFVIEEDK